MARIGYTLSDPDQAPAAPRDGLPEPFSIADSRIAEAIYAGNMTTGQVRDRIAAAAGLWVETTHELIDGLSRRDADPASVRAYVRRILLAEDPWVGPGGFSGHVG